MSKPGVSDKIYPSAKLAAVVDALVEEGVSLSAALRGVLVTPDELHSPLTLVSLEQLLTGCKNAIRLSRDRSLPFRIGSSIHASAYGMYGYAILCGTDFRRVTDFCVKYHVLATPLVELSFVERDGFGVWTITPMLHQIVDEPLYRFVVELQIGVEISIHRDVMGESFAPSEITLTYSQKDDFRLTEDLVGCRLRFEQGANQVIFDAKWLDHSATLGNRITYSGIVALCDDLLLDLTHRTGIIGKIRATLLREIANPPTFAATAKLLGATTRTLRRQLKRQGTSFRDLIDEMRAQIAVKYLRETVMTNEDIAMALGFSDGTNFRRAFRRWTAKTPSEFRRDIHSSR